MALPVIAALQTTRKFSGDEEKEKPRALSTEGITMLALSGVLEGVNILLGFLDFLFGIGILLGPVVNLAGTVLIGGWLWLRFGKAPLKKALGPLIANSIPFAKFFPWWLLSVGTSLKWQGSPLQSSQTMPKEDHENVHNSPTVEKMVR
mgnify:CR=1 FL=1